MPDRNMNWSLLSEEFLDCEPSSVEIERTIQALTRNGFTAEDIRYIRSEVKAQMKAYNFDSMLLESNHLSIFDVLCAMTGAYSNPKDYASFYWRAMEIEMRKTAPVNFSDKLADFARESNKT